jgi:hypothetical protein
LGGGGGANSDDWTETLILFISIIPLRGGGLIVKCIVSGG